MCFFKAIVRKKILRCKRKIFLEKAINNIANMVIRI